MLLILPLLILAVLIYQKVSTKVYQAMLAKRSELNTKLNEYISGMRIIQQFRQESRLGNEFEKTNDEYYGYRKRVIQINGILLSPLVNFLMAISIVVVLLMYSNRSLHAVVEFLLTEVEIPCCGANSFSSMIVLMRLEATNPFEKFDKESINPEIGLK